MAYKKSLFDFLVIFPKWVLEWQFTTSFSHYDMKGEQISLDLDDSPSVGTILDRIRSESRDESEKGRWFEQLFIRAAKQQPEFEIENIWRWVDWPEREELTERDGRDIGIDLVVRRTSGEWVAI